jgi:hypothetical protein
VVVVVVSRGSLTHPPVLHGARPLPASRGVMAALALVLFVLTFVPKPF